MARQVRGITVHGDENDNVIVGTSGNDNLHGNGGNDTLDGGDGADNIYGNAGDDMLIGGSGNDTISGHEGNDTLQGGDGDDYLAGQEGSDIVNGGAGNDFIGGGPGQDVLTGGTGADRFFFTANFEGGMNVRTITDFNSSEGDYIDLRSIDADGDSSNNSRRSNTDFTLVDFPSGAAGEAWFEPFTDPVTGVTGISIFLNDDADPEPDDRIDVLGVTWLDWGTDILG